MGQNYIIGTDSGYGSLSHHGILGMKWGVRRYQNADGSLTAVGRRRYASAERSELKAETAKTSLGKQYHTYNAAAKRSEIDRANRVKAAKGLGNKFSEAFGYKNDEAENKFVAEYRAKNAEIAKTKLGKAYNEKEAYNANAKSEYAALMKNKRLVGKIFEQRVPLEARNIKVQTLVGRKSTIGKERVLKVLTLGLGKVALDAAYLHDKSKLASLDKKIQKTEANKDFDVKSYDAITEDLKYKNGKTFYSVEGAKRDQQITADWYDKKLDKLRQKRDKYSSRVNG